MKKIKTESSHSVSISVIPASRLSLALAIASDQRNRFEIPRNHRRGEIAMIARGYLRFRRCERVWAIPVYAVFRETSSRQRQRRDHARFTKKKRKEKREEKIARTQGAKLRSSIAISCLGSNGRARWDNGASVQ